jgi:hypothetical protein
MMIFQRGRDGGGAASSTGDSSKKIMSFMLRPLVDCACSFFAIAQPQKDFIEYQ